MMIFPTIELQNRRCVTLNKGRRDDPMIWHVDPVETARGFAEAGASWMHVTDFDAVTGEETNVELVQEIIRAAGIPVQLRGGFRARQQVETWMDRGVGRVVIGSLAVHDPQLVKDLAKYYPDQIVLAVDVWQGQVTVDGEDMASLFDPADFLASFAEAPLAAVILTDVHSDMEDADAQIGLISGLAQTARAPVIASGMVRTLDDVARLKYVPGIAGAIVGRALFRKTVDLAEAIALAESAPEPVADFR